jgi:predicted dehydrogenase
MKIALLGTGFGQVHTAIYAQCSDVDEVIVFGRSPQKLAKVGGEFGFVTTTDLDAVITDPSVDLVDICLPTRLHAGVAVRAMQAGKDVLIELPLAATIEDARRVVAASGRPGGRRLSTCSPGSAPPASSCGRPWPSSVMGRCECWRSRAAPRCCGRVTTWA